MKAKIWLHLLVLLALLLPALPGAPAQAGGIIYVDKDAIAGGNEGSSWISAYTDLQAALNKAGSDDQVWVAEGTYTPGNNRGDTFQLKSGVAVYGGFAGGEVSLEQRNWATNVTTLSGDLDDDGDPSDNSYHVVTAGPGLDSDAVLDGFTVTAGSANGSFPDGDGAGMLIDAASPSVRHVIFTRNEASNWGGGLFNYNGGSPLLTGVTFRDNSAGAKGGGMYNQNSSPTLEEVTFEGNWGGDAGGGFLNDAGSPTLADVTFTGNSADWGGGLHSSGLAVLTLTGATFIANPATYGGAIYNGAALTLSDALVSDHIADDTGGGIYNDGTLELINVVISANQAADRGGGIFNALGTAGLSGIEVTFKGNEATYRGGGLHNEGGEVELTAGVFGGGNVASEGGAIANIAGDVKLYDTVVTQNSALGDGGGLYNDFLGHMTLQDCTVDNNDSSGHGGGIASGGWLTLLNSTVSGNAAKGDGGGILAAGKSIYLRNATITGNQADSEGDGMGDAGGVFFEIETASVLNTIIAANADGSLEDVYLYPDCRLSFPEGDVTLSYGGQYNLFGNGVDCPQLADPEQGNLAGDSDFPLDPGLYRLAGNGGPTPTHALRYDSLARDAGDPIGCKDQFGGPIDVDQRGMLRPRDADGDGIAVCDIGAYETGLSNDAWTRALELELTGDPLWAEKEEYVDKLGQSRWYKFSVFPGSQVTVKLEPGAANYDLILYKDIAAAYEALIFSSAEDLIRLDAEFAPDMFSPDMFSPDMFSPDMFSPDMFSPDMFSPDMFSPDMFSPDMFSPDMFSPDMFSPDMFSPDMFSPDMFSPDMFSPDMFSPERLAFVSAQLRSMVAVSAFEGTAGEVVVANTWDNMGDFYVRVRGRNGAFSLAQPFHLEVTQVTGVCREVDLISRSGDPTLPDPGFETLFLTDWSRFDDTDPYLETLQTQLPLFASSMSGTVIDVSLDLYVDGANGEADANPQCPFAKNQVAWLIKDIVNAYREANGETLKYVVIVGNDDVIPFFRYPDRALLANERNYKPPVIRGTASDASLALGYVLSQDAYGSRVDLSLSNTSLPVPDLAVGRLVETPAEILEMLKAFTSPGDGETPGVISPESALVTGYDFLEDAALKIRAELAVGLAPDGIVDSLITPQTVAPLDRDGDPPGDAPWPASMLVDQLDGSDYDLIFLAGHFSAGSALAADYETRLLASELVSSTANLTNTLVWSAGCHSGYNIVNEHGFDLVTPEPDWAQAFAQKGATYVGGTGYQYGDSDFVEYSERLYLEFTRALRCGQQPVSIGQALVAAKQAYLAGTAQMRGIHEKSLLEATLYGLPMLQVAGLERTECPPGPGSDLTAPPGDVTEDPGLFLGLRFADLTVDSSLTPETVPLLDAEGNLMTTTYLSGTHGVIINPAEPVLPLERRNVSVDDSVLRGIGFRGGNYTDQEGVIPLTGAATTEIRGVHTPFQSEVFYPIRPWRANYFDALAKPGSGITWLDVTPAQFVSTGPDPWVGTLRRFDDMEFRLYYSNHTQSHGENVPALAAPPAIVKVLATEENGDVEFRATVVGDPTAGIQEVWVTYTTNNFCEAGAVCTWQSLDLTQDEAESTLWTGTLSSVSAGDLRYMVQAVSGVGLVTLATNMGEYFRVGIDPADPSTGGDPGSPPLPTALSADSLPDAGAYGTGVELRVELTSDGSPLTGQGVMFALGPLRRWAATDGEGYAQVTMPLLLAPGLYDLRVTFPGSTEFQPSSVVSPFTITKQATLLSLMFGLNTTGDQIQLVAALTDALARPLRERTVLFVFTTDTASYAVSAITNYAGQAPVDQSLLPDGSYSVTAYFGDVVALPEGGALDLTDPCYGPATATLSGGFVTGGGWIESPVGAYTKDPALTGRATFGFVAKYQKGTNLPIGQTQFRFRAGDLNFHSDSYEKLVVAGSKAMFKGVGTINGAGSYGFMIKAVDAELTPSTDLDLFRIKIWETATDAVVYDNEIGVSDDSEPTMAIAGGSIVIHPGK